MSTFEFTHDASGDTYSECGGDASRHTQIESSLVDEAYYNENTRELLVDLNDSLYRYSNVPLSAYERLVNAPSIGSAFSEVKSRYGPSIHEGIYGDVDYVAVEPRAAVPMTPVVAFGGGFGVQDTTPKGLTLAPDAVVTGRKIDLAPAPTAPKARQHTVVGTANGNPFTHRPAVASVDEALAVMAELSEATGVEFVVREVVVAIA